LRGWNGGKGSVNSERKILFCGFMRTVCWWPSAYGADPMTTASHFIAAEGGGTRSSPFALFDGPRYAQMAVGKREGLLERYAFFQTSASMNRRDDGPRAEFAAGATLPD
jgi:hypothetical protein